MIPLRSLVESAGANYHDLRLAFHWLLDCMCHFLRSYLAYRSQSGKPNYFCSQIRVTLTLLQEITWHAPFLPGLHRSHSLLNVAEQANEKRSTPNGGTIHERRKLGGSYTPFLCRVLSENEASFPFYGVGDPNMGLSSRILRHRNTLVPDICCNATTQQR